MFFIITTVLILITLFYIYRRQKLKFFIKAGINGPPPHFLFGNLLEINRTPSYELMSKWGQKYGKTFGYFEGPTPNLVVGDPEIIQEIFVKQFSNFHGHKLFPLRQNPDKEIETSLLFTRGKRWKRLRTTINPAFSESKMRTMFQLIDESISLFISKINHDISENQSDINVQEYLLIFTMDIICKCSFGVDTNCQTDNSHSFINVFRRLFHQSPLSNPFALLVLTFSELKSTILFISKYLMKYGTLIYPFFEEIHSKLIQVIETRRKSSEKKQDLLQLVLDAEVPDIKLFDENSIPFNTDNKINIEHKIKDVGKKEIEPEIVKSQIKPKQLTTEEVIGLAFSFVSAGSHSTATALSYIIYLLAIHPHVQKKLQQEIDQVSEGYDSTNIPFLILYESIARLPYLKAVIYEVLRMHPFSLNVATRMCLRSGGTYLSNGLYIPEGLNIIPNIYEIHHDKNIWTGIDPKVFAPERFLKETGNKFEFVGPPHPYAWLSFGAGPRKCVAEGFAMTIMKATLVKFFLNFQIKPSKRTEIPLKVKERLQISPENGIYVDIFYRKFKESDNGSI